MPFSLTHLPNGATLKKTEVLFMKRLALFSLLLLFVVLLPACGKQDAATPPAQTQPAESTQIEAEVQPEEESCTISGSFTVSVHDVLPWDSFTPSVAVVSEFQSYPFTVFVGDEIGRELADRQDDNTVFVFTIEPIEVNRSKEDVQNMRLSSIVWEFRIKITDCRPAEENELGLASLCLTVE